MGVRPSVTGFQEVTQAAIDVCLTSGVGSGSTVGCCVEAWRGFVFIDIDDVKVSSKGDPELSRQRGSGFTSTMELELQIATDHVIVTCCDVS